MFLFLLAVLEKRFQGKTRPPVRMVIQKEKFIFCVSLNNCVKMGLIHSATCGCPAKCVLPSKLLQCHKYGLSSQSLPSACWFLVFSEFSPLFNGKAFPLLLYFHYGFSMVFPLLFSPLADSPGHVQSADRVQSISFSLCFGLLQMTLFIFSYSSKTLPTNNRVVMLADSLLHTLPLDYLFKRV